MTDEELTNLLDRITTDYALPINGTHGVGHWSRVLANGRKLAEITGADVNVVELFALFHDARRVNENQDPGHGVRGAELAKSLRGHAFDITDEQFNLLHTACSLHTDTRTHPEITIATCFDADRLDLGRVGVEPHQSGLAILFREVDETTSRDLIRWAHGRASFHYCDQWIKTWLERFQESN